jgi:valyl-tRNA synthetase
LPPSLYGRGGGIEDAGDEGHPESLPIATTRPELLPACAAVFIHPEDARYNHLAGREVSVPIFGQKVPILLDPAADPNKGSGAVMCCTFGDTTDVAWWRTHTLPLVQAIDRDGRMTAAAGPYGGQTLTDARRQIKIDLDHAGLILGRQPTTQSVRVHERCDTPVEYIMVNQWFVKILDAREALLQIGECLNWRPEHMVARYRGWVENLGWDWCISRQRYYGVPFPLWYCRQCGQPVLADENQLPVDPQVDQPAAPCPQCGGGDFIPEEDIFDTWATSSLSPQIVGQMAWDTEKKDANQLYNKVFPFSLRPQAHEIIRTWAFYTITKSHFHFGVRPWRDVLISGWGIAGEGMGKISKSRGGGPMPPLEMIQRYSADAVRYWAASTSPGKDSVISEEKVQMGAKLVTKLWNVARFAERFVTPNPPDITMTAGTGRLTPADRWILSRAQRLVRRVTGLMEGYEYATAKSEIEIFFWGELADNYLEMCKQRLYDPEAPAHMAARSTLAHVLSTILKLLAPFLPYVTEEIYQGLFTATPTTSSIHSGGWPEAIPDLEDDAAEQIGAILVEIATAARRFKSEHSLSLGTELSLIQLAFADGSITGLLDALSGAQADLKSITRARQITISSTPNTTGTHPVGSVSLMMKIEL